MFASLKNKIKEETGSDVSSASSLAVTTSTTTNRISNNNRIRSRLSSTVSINSTDEAVSTLGSSDPHGYQVVRIVYNKFILIFCFIYYTV